MLLFVVRSKVASLLMHYEFGQRPIPIEWHHEQPLVANRVLSRRCAIISSKLNHEIVELK